MNVNVGNYIELEETCYNKYRRLTYKVIGWDGKYYSCKAPGNITLYREPIIIKFTMLDLVTLGYRVVPKLLGVLRVGE